MTHWLAKVTEILESDTSDLRRLASIAGFDPKLFYRGADLSRADIRDQDLRGMDFTGADLRYALINRGTLIDPEFDPRPASIAYKISVSVGSDLLHLIRLYARYDNYTYIGAAVKNLIWTSTFYLPDIEIEDWEEKIERSNEIQRILNVYNVKRFPLTLSYDVSNMSYMSKVESVDSGLKNLIIMGLVFRSRLSVNDIKKGIIDRLYNIFGGKLGIIPVNHSKGEY
jgi:hypothetical protein